MAMYYYIITTMHYYLQIIVQVIWVSSLGLSFFFLYVFENKLSRDSDFNKPSITKLSVHV